MIRRSVSSWLSPGPREPMPPWVRERWVQRRVRRGSWYSSCASSTWRRPSWVCACWAKMSRISRLRSMTLTLRRLSSDFCWLGESSSSATSRLKPVSLLAGEQLLGLALADVPVGVDMAAVLPLGADDLRAGRHRRGWRARRASPRRSSRGRRRHRPRAGRPARRAARDRSVVRAAHAPQCTCDILSDRPRGACSRARRRRAMTNPRDVDDTPLDPRDLA